MRNKTEIHLINCAAKVFSIYGYKKTSMEDIARKSGKGKSSLYYYFKNKEEVFEAVVNLEAETLKKEIEGALIKSSSAKEQLRNYIYLRMQRFIAKGNLYTALKDNFLTTISFIHKVRDQHREWEVKIISDILAKGIENKEFKNLNTQFIAESLLTAMIGFELPILIKETPTAEFEEKINHVMDMFFYGICSN